jgi:hypothetical protein
VSPPESKGSHRPVVCNECNVGKGALIKPLYILHFDHRGSFRRDLLGWPASDCPTSGGSSVACR